MYTYIYIYKTLLSLHDVSQWRWWVHTRDSLSISSPPALTLQRPPVLHGEKRAMGEAESGERGEAGGERRGWGARRGGAPRCCCPRPLSCCLETRWPQGSSRCCQMTWQTLLPSTSSVDIGGMRCSLVWLCTCFPIFLYICVCVPLTVIYDF